MNLQTKKLWNRNFSLVALCNALAMLGNMTLSFVLAYYVRDITGSETMFGLALSLPYVSLFIMSPIGGIMADRIKKQRIMLWVDLSVATVILIFLAVNGLFASALLIVFIKLLALNAAQGAYMSTTNAAVPFVVPTNKLPSGNAIMGMINSLVGAGGMALAAILYERFGLYPILIPFAVLYGLMAFMDSLIRIPFNKPTGKSNIAQIVKSDISGAVLFLSKDKPILAKLAFIAFGICATVLSLIMIGTPIIITETLGMDLSLVGISQVFMAIGGLVGGIVASTLSNRLSINKLPLWVMGISISPVLVALTMLLNAPAIVVFLVLTSVCAFAMFALTVIIVTTITYVQTETPSEVLGKVVSLFTMLPFLAQAIGQFAFGVLFESFAELPWLVIIIAVIISALFAIYSYRHLKNNSMRLVEQQFRNANVSVLSLEDSGV